MVEVDDSNESEVQGLVLEAVQTLPETGLETHETAGLAGGLILLGAALLFTNRESEPGFRS